MSEHRDHAEIVVIGGGAVGCAVAYSLAKAGKTDVLLVEREPVVGAVTTCQAAGLVGQVRNTVERTKLAMWSVATFAELQEDTDANPAWRPVGSLRIALDRRRVEEFEHMKSVADASGLETRFLDRDAAKAKWPIMDFDKIEAALWCPTDGYLQPSDLTAAYVAHGRRMGVRYRTGTTVEEIDVAGGRVRGVVTDHGRIDCETVVNAAGAHAWHIAQLVGLELPIVPVRHEFFVTIPAEGFAPEMPVMRIPDISLYLRAETSSLLCGGWEPNGLASDPRDYVIGQLAPLIDDDWDVLGTFAADLSSHIPAVDGLGIRSVFKGWPTFTPDGRFIIGESDTVAGFVMAGGCNAHGVSGSAGIGRHVVESMLDPDPSPYVRSLSPDRFAGYDAAWSAASRNARRHYETYYALGH